MIVQNLYYGGNLLESTRAGTASRVCFVWIVLCQVLNVARQISRKIDAKVAGDADVFSVVASVSTQKVTSANPSRQSISELISSVYSLKNQGPTRDNSSSRKIRARWISLQVETFGRRVCKS